VQQPIVLALCALALFAGGSVKGVAGIGLPLVALPLLTYLVNLPAAVALTVVSMIVSNLVQSFQGGYFLPVLRRFWALLAALFAATVLGTRLLVVVPEKTLDLVIGIAVIVMPLLLHFRRELRIPPRQERWLNPLVGVVSGLLGGISSYYGPPLMLYALGLRLPKEEFVPAVSMFYWVAAIGLFIGLYVMGAANLVELGLSVVMLVPVFIGMWAGRFIHVQLDEQRFARILTAIYIVTGLSFLHHAFG
jgi:uncharacterized membrane protein YfcA